MRVLLANLKLLCQRRSVWTACGFYVLVFGLNWFSLRLSAEADQAGRNMVLLALVSGALVIGADIGLMQMLIAAHPLSFCLPGHRIAVRRLIFLMGAAVALASACLFVFITARTAIPPGRSGLALCSMFCVSLALFLAGAACPSSRMGLLAAVLLCLPIFMIFVFPGPTAGLLPSVPSAIEYAMIHFSGLLIALGTLSAAGVWIWLGRVPEFLRTGGDRRGRGLLRRRGRSTPADWASEPPEGAMDRAFLKAMARYESATVPGYIWGALYAWLLPGGGGRLVLISTVLEGAASGALAWYMPYFGPFFIASAALSPGLGVWSLSTFMNSPVLVACGRRERFFTSLTLVLILGSIATCGVVLGVVTMKWLGVLPWLIGWTDIGGPRSYWGMVWTQPTNLKLVFLLMALLPVGCLREIKLSGRGVWRTIASWAIVNLIWLPAYFARPLLTAIPLAYVIICFLLLWGAGVYGLYRVAMNSDLGRR
jgi:hypothetical protein